MLILGDFWFDVSLIKLLKKFFNLWVCFFVCLIWVILICGCEWVIGVVVVVCGGLDWLVVILFVIGLLVCKLIFVILEEFEFLVRVLVVDEIFVFDVVIVIWFIGILV